MANKSSGVMAVLVLVAVGAAFLAGLYWQPLGAIVDKRYLAIAVGGVGIAFVVTLGLIMNLRQEIGFLRQTAQKDIETAKQQASDKAAECDANLSRKLQECTASCQQKIQEAQGKLQALEEEKKQQLAVAAQRIQYLEEEIIRIRGYIKASDGCTYDQIDKCWIEEKTSERYCSACMDKNIRSPCYPTIVNGTPSMKCSVCGA